MYELKDNEISLSQLFRVIKPYTKNILQITISVMVAVFLITKILITPVYLSSGKILISHSDFHYEDIDQSTISLPNISNENIELALNSNLSLSKIQADLVKKGLLFDVSKLNIFLIKKADAFQFDYISSNRENAKEVLDSILVTTLDLFNEIWPEITVKMINSASLPEKALDQNTNLYVMISGLFTFFLSIGYILLDFLKNDSLYSKSNSSFIEKNILIEIPNKVKLVNKKVFKRKNHILSLPNIAEEISDIDHYLLIKANIIQGLNKNDINTILFASLLDIEGRDEVIVNIATLLSKCNYKVLVLNPTFKSDLAFEPLFCEKGNYYELQYSVALGSSVFINSDNFQNNFKNLKKEFDLVLINSPSVSSNKIIYEVVENINYYYFIIRQNVSKRTAVQEIIMNLEKFNKNLCGFILIDE